MKILGIINEPPYDPLSWSGSSRFFFSALDRAGLLAQAIDIDMSKALDSVYRLLNIGPNRASWRERYHLDTRRFKILSRIAARHIRARSRCAQAVLQIGAWYSVADRVKLPCYSYHDGNLAVRIATGHTVLGAGHPSVRRAMRWEHDTYSRLTGLFAMSRWLADSFVRDFGVPHSKVHVAGAGINFDQLPVVAAGKSYQPRFLMVGKDFKRKGGAILLEAFAKVRQRVPAAELVLVGPDIPNPPAGVRCLGFLSKANPQELATLQATFASAGIYVLPSLYEPFGISLLEAMANSLPCIAANHCAMPEIVEHRVSGLVVRPGDVVHLAEAMTELALAPETARAFGEAGRARLIERYTWDAVAARIGQVVCSGPAGLGSGSR
jgi:glycosyltransferase involved in cell wall biosynthesis